MSFKVGDRVTVTLDPDRRSHTLQKEGVVIGIRKKGALIRVACGDITLDLPPLSLQFREELPHPPPSPLRRLDLTSTQFKTDIEIDLHGLRVHEALAELERSLDQALLSGAHEVRVIHGIGTGRVMDAVTHYLAHCSHVRTFVRAPDNPGVTKVLLS
jgi:DNA mismatch repair protein MutS2